MVGIAVLCGCAGPRGGSGITFGRRGAPWTISCLELRGPNRVPHAEQFATTLKRTPGIRADDVWTADGLDGVARIYYGTYYRRTDSRTGRRNMPAKMREDLDFLRQLGNESGQLYFLQAMPVRMPMPDVGNPEWALSRVSATYSLQVGVFEPTDEFWEHKRAAAEFCKLLRDKGFEAYFFHGAACSVVTVGAFGPDAVRTGADGLVYYSPQVRALQRNELLKYNLLNGSIYRVRDENGTAVPVPSRLVEIPHTAEVGPG